MKTSTAALLACLLVSLAAPAGAQTVSPAFDAWLKARRDAHARLLPTAPVAATATAGLGVPHAMAVATAPAEPTAATTLETAPTVAQPAPPVSTCTVLAEDAPPVQPTPAPPPRVVHAGRSAAVSVPSYDQAPLVPAAPNVAPAPAPPAVIAAAAPKIVAPPPAPVRHTRLDTAPRTASAARLPTRDYDMAVAGPRVTIATGGVDMGQYLALSGHYLRYQ
ncbi:hypothetical protein [Pseudoxanthomonas winnipegensis]|uniref:Uncharacterized protein n=1 Tax=Pseudoxanthomonas winnipegensis TaxID=2480810 RepID=A0A4Q8LNZ7_9GAMM|nr:hypothetical protein [Pseudoxanthomonas winnipegensis]RZZ89615.1 hypothetical protein EA662_04405 [Pseudoxanthomonas winnipegensis]TAA32944.1 hypothetical protein EA661_01285 [Pseudoxanthomonas winnipegensis]TBV78573.1 hypothetical protein EYC46_01385 [Pseudoxanthomonas winnipegensis]